MKTLELPTLLFCWRLTGSIIIVAFLGVLGALAANFRFST
jgi:hypothetical protein